MITSLTCEVNSNLLLFIRDNIDKINSLNIILKISYGPNECIYNNTIMRKEESIKMFLLTGEAKDDYSNYEDERRQKYVKRGNLSVPNEIEIDESQKNTNVLLDDMEAFADHLKYNPDSV